MTEGEKGVLSLFVIGVMIVVGKVLAGGEPITPRLFIGRMLLGGFVSMVAGVVLVQFPDMSLPAVCGIGSMLGIAGYQVVEIAIQRRFKSQQGIAMPVINTHQNIAAFLDMLAYSEGTATHPLTKIVVTTSLSLALMASRKFSPTTPTTLSHMADQRKCLIDAAKNPRHQGVTSSFISTGRTIRNNSHCLISARCRRTNLRFS